MALPFKNKDRAGHRRRGSKGRKVFFFEKKKQKTFNNILWFEGRAFVNSCRVEKRSAFHHFKHFTIRVDQSHNPDSVLHKNLKLNGFYATNQLPFVAQPQILRKIGTTGTAAKEFFKLHLRPQADGFKPPLA